MTSYNGDYDQAIERQNHPENFEEGSIDESLEAVLNGTEVGICAELCEHKFCNEVRALARIGLNPYGAFVKKSDFEPLLEEETPDV